MDPLEIIERPGCGCGESDQELPELDARAIPHALRHAAILGVVSGLEPGQGFVLVAPHDPLPLLAQIEQRFGAGQIAVAYLQREPQAVRLSLTRG